MALYIPWKEHIKGLILFISMSIICGLTLTKKFDSVTYPASPIHGICDSTRNHNCYIVMVFVSQYMKSYIGQSSILMLLLIYHSTYLELLYGKTYLTSNFNVVLQFDGFFYWYSVIPQSEWSQKRLIGFQSSIFINYHDIPCRVSENSKTGRWKPQLSLELCVSI